MIINLNLHLIGGNLLQLNLIWTGGARVHLEHGEFFLFYTSKEQNICDVLLWTFNYKLFLSKFDLDVLLLHLLWHVKATKANKTQRQ